MVSEELCLQMIDRLHGTVTTHSESRGPGSPEGRQKEHQIEHALAEGELYRTFLVESELHAIEAAIRWLTLGGFFSTITWGIRGLTVYQLSDKGLAVAEAGRFPEEERRKFYREDPYAVFLARQFADRDEELVSYLHDLLEPAFRIEEGTADALEQFRTAILTKIKRCRYFICLLTHREELVSGGFASSVWLYQEIGAAVALGREPLIIVEEGIADHYAGELQRAYEFISFGREDYRKPFEAILPRLKRDLEKHGIPLPGS